MSTPFDGITWKLRCHIEGHTDPLPETDIKDWLPTKIPVNQKIYNQHGIEPKLPLRECTSFNVTITEDQNYVETVTIDFLGNAPQNIKDIWANAQNVYYDREFYAVRGELMYDTNTGKPDTAFGSHFMIAYDGRMATGGSSRQLSIYIGTEADIARPTFVWRHWLFHTMPSGGGSWKADD